MRTDLASVLQQLPKVELHLHLEGTFTAERIAALAREAGECLPVPAHQLFDVPSLAVLLQRLDWWCGLVTTAEQAHQQAYDLARYLTEDGVVYAEVIVNPTHWQRLEPAVLLDAVSHGFEKARAYGLTDCRVLASLRRDQTAEEAMNLVRSFQRHLPERLVGLSVDGNEAQAGPTGARFASAYAAAADLGLGRTAHAGESSGPDGVRSALEDLGVSRIDHGIRAVEDVELLRRLAAEHITLNVALSSNQALLGLDPASHPVKRLRAAHVPVTINTDDPMPLATTMTWELQLAATSCGFGVSGAIAVTRTAIAAAFCSKATAEELSERLDTYAASTG